MQRANWKDWRQNKKGVAEDEMVRWHHCLNGHEFEQTLGESKGQRSLACYNPWSHKELDMIYQLNNNIPIWFVGCSVMGIILSGLFAYSGGLFWFLAVLSVWGCALASQACEASACFLKLGSRAILSFTYSLAVKCRFGQKFQFTLSVVLIIWISYLNLSGFSKLELPSLALLASEGSFSTTISYERVMKIGYHFSPKDQKS